MTFNETPPTARALLPLLGRAGEPAAEAGVDFPGELAPTADPALIERAAAAKAALGDRVFVLGHHYQRDEVIALTDVTGDSFKLAQQAAARPEAEHIVFCGVHFMAEAADLLTAPNQHVVLPDPTAGCAMADMADAGQARAAWDTLVGAGVAAATVPVTYINSSAAIKGFTGEHGGTVCTSSNAERALSWALAKGEKVLFLPDQHLGRNTALRQLGMSPDDCVVYDPNQPGGGLSARQLRAATIILWRGHCAVHARFTAGAVAEARALIPGVRVLVHPECGYDVVSAADDVGSTEFIVKTLADAPAGSAWAVGTELSLVRRLARQHPDKRIVFLGGTIAYCATMSQIDMPALTRALEQLAAGRAIDPVTVDPAVVPHARAALDQMLALP
ncbi:MAG: quinolinate synthase NadA [Actinomycetia bacterium]|nr:quinolinate synthase NadA [Actinomycetes bacterium]